LPSTFRSESQNWLEAYTDDFRKRMLNLLGFDFRKLHCALAFQLVQKSQQANNTSSLQAIESGDADDQKFDSGKISKQKLEGFISVFDLKRLESYSKNLVDFHLIMDLVPTIAKLFFSVLQEGTITLSYV
jgi:N-acetyltransferase 10